MSLAGRCRSWPASGKAERPTAAAGPSKTSGHPAPAPRPFHYLSPDGTTFIPAGQDFTTGATMWGTKMADVLRAFRLAPAVAGRPFYVTNEAELKTWAFTVEPDGTLSNPKLFAPEGGEAVAVDNRGNVYLAAGQILVFDPAGRQIGTIEVPQRPTCLVFGGPDRNTLFITARSSLYSVQVRSGSPNAQLRVWEPSIGLRRVE